MRKVSIWGTIRFYDNKGNLSYERRYYNKEARTGILKQMIHREYSYYHILPGWTERVSRAVYDDVKTVSFDRPPAIYDNQTSLYNK